MSVLKCVIPRVSCSVCLAVYVLQVYLPPEAAYNCVAELGELGECWQPIIVQQLIYNSQQSKISKLHLQYPAHSRTCPVRRPEPRRLGLPAPVRRGGEEVRGDGEEAEVSAAGSRH